MLAEASLLLWCTRPRLGRGGESGFGSNPIFVGEGGSNGAMLSIQRVFGAPIIFLGLSLPEHAYHAVNEYFDGGQAKGGILACTDYFRRLGEV